MKNQESSRDFDLAAVLNITSGRFLTNFDDIYDVMNYLVGRQLYSHELYTFMPIAKKYILDQYPELYGVADTDAFKSFEQIKNYIDSRRATLGNTITLKPMVPGIDFDNKSFEEILEDINKPVIIVDMTSENNSNIIKKKPKALSKVKKPRK